MTRWAAGLTLLMVLSAAAADPPARLEFDLDGDAGAYTPERGHGFDLGIGPRSAAFFYSVRVPEGNWRVRVTLGDLTGSSATTIRAESRRLMVESVATQPGEQVGREFVVNIRIPDLPAVPANAPGGERVRLNPREGGVLHWDDKLTLEFTGPAPRVSRIELEPAPDALTVFLAGDSTVTDQPAEPAAAWGQMLPRFLAGEVAVANHAESGETLKSFLTGLRFDKLLSLVKPGDHVLIQFGHNDSKAQWSQTYAEAGTTFEAYLRVYLAEVRRRAAIPVLLTPPQRRVFDDDGRIRNTHGDYPAAVRTVAATEGVALIDLAEASTRFYEALGPERAPLAFNANGADATHHNNFGAYVLARFVAAELARTSLPVAGHVPVEARSFDPGKPGAPADFRLPPSPLQTTTAPRGN